MSLSDSHLQQISRLCIPGHPPALAPSHGGSPRFLDASFRARSPQPPRGVLQVLLSVASLQVSGFVISGSLTTPTWRNEAESGSLSLGLARSQSVGFSYFAIQYNLDHRSASCARLPSHRGPPLHGERTITTVDTVHSTRSTRLILAHQSARKTRKRAMKALVFYGEVRPDKHHPVPERKQSEVLIRVTKAGVSCGDYSLFSLPTVDFPLSCP